MLSNGLNLRKKPPPQPPVQPKSSSRPAASFFNDEDEEDDSPPDIRSRPFYAPGKSSLKETEIDASDAIYDYDGVYEAMKSGDREAARIAELDKKERKPKYMQNLFDMAEIRQQDRLRAEDVKLQREREAEGDAFADKDAFVTGAYRAQQEEHQRRQAQEEAKEAALRKQAAGGMSAFQQNLMQEDIRRHEAAVQASLRGNKGGNSVQGEDVVDEQVRAERQRIQDAEAKLGHKVAVNDDNQVIDHRELLTAGLNRVGKSDKHLRTEELAKKARPVLSQKEKEDRQAQIDRQQRVLRAQMEESRKRQASEIERQEAALKVQAKRTKTEADVSSAKERYLARKKAEAEAAAHANDIPKD